MLNRMTAMQGQTPDRVITPIKMAALQGSRGSITDLLGQEYLQSQARAGNPRRGSAIGNYGRPVPPDSLKFGGSSLFQDQDGRKGGSQNNSGRNSPVHLPVQAWGAHGDHKKFRTSSSSAGGGGEKNGHGGHLAKTEADMAQAASKLTAFTTLYSETEKDPIEEPTGLKRLIKFLTFGLSGDADSPGCCALLLALVSVLCCLATLPLSLIFCVKVVKEYERAVIFRLGRLRKGGAKGPGIFFIVPCIDSYKKLDLRTVSFDVPPQEILSRDSVTVSVDAVVYYRVSNPTMATNNVEDYRHSTHLLAATTLRNVLGTKCLAQVLSEREQISDYMQSTLDEATDPWGVKVERVEIKDVRLPIQLQRAMAAEAEATREARAKVIAAEGEKNAAVNLRSASDVISDNPAAMQLRYLQTLSSISAEKNSTIIFPLPLDILQAFSRR